MDPQTPDDGLVQYSIAGPDGKTYSISGPKGATREQVIAKIKERLALQGKPVPGAPQAKPKAGLGAPNIAGVPSMDPQLTALLRGGPLRSNFPKAPTAPMPMRLADILRQPYVPGQVSTPSVPPETTVGAMGGGTAAPRGRVSADLLRGLSDDALDRAIEETYTPLTAARWVANLDANNSGDARQQLQAEKERRQGGGVIATVRNLIPNIRSAFADLAAPDTTPAQRVQGFLSGPALVTGAPVVDDVIGGALKVIGKFSPPAIRFMKSALDKAGGNVEEAVNAATKKWSLAPNQAAALRDALKESHSGATVRLGEDGKPIVRVPAIGRDVEAAARQSEHAGGGQKGATRQGKAKTGISGETPAKGATGTIEANASESVGSSTKPKKFSIKEDEPPPSGSTLAPPPAKETPTGLARRLEDPERIARNKQPLPKQGVSIKDLEARGRYLYDKVKPDVVLKKEAGKIEPDDVALMAYHKRVVKNRSEAVDAMLNEGVADPLEKAALLNEQEQLASHYDDIDAFARDAGGKFHQLGQALQIAHNRDYSIASLRSMAKAANGGEAVAAKAMDPIEDSGKQLAALTKQLAAARKELDNLKAIKGPQKLGTKQYYLDRIKYDLGQSAKDTGAALTSKKAGAAQLPIKDMARQSANIRGYARHLVADGADTLDKVLAGFHDAVPGLSDEQILSGLSDKYRGYAHDIDQTNLALNAQLSGLRRAARYRQLPAIAKAGYIAKGITSDLFYGSKLAVHATQPLMQGRKVALIDPSAWVAGVKANIGGLAKGYSFLDAQHARFMAEPAFYKAAKVADLQMTGVHGAATAMEEHMGQSLVNKIPLANKIFEHSSAGFAGAGNEMRWQLFKAVARGHLDDPVYLKQMAYTINTITGRSNSRFAKALGDATGNLFFGPRYTASKWEFASGAPIRSAIKAGSPEAAAQTAKMYAKVAAGNVALLYSLHKMVGADVVTDPRRSDFGRVIIGNNKIDIFTQEAEPVKLLMQMILGKTYEDGGKAQREPGKVALDYLEGKLGPTAKAIEAPIMGEYNAEGRKTKSASGDTPAGQSKNAPPFDWGTWLKDLAEPIAYQSSSEEGGRGASLSLLNLIGLGVRAKSPPMPGKSTALGPKLPRPPKPHLPKPNLK